MLALKQYRGGTIMIKRQHELKVTAEHNANGEEKMYLADLSDFKGKNEKLKMFSHISLNAGEEVEYHVHKGEFESYYILSGKGLYSDNGREMEVEKGVITFTPSGEGHGIKNIGNDTLEFIALIIKD